MKKKRQCFDIIVIGSGMGGMTAASLFANQGRNVLVLEAAHLPGGCSSSYKRKGYIFESGATTLIGFDENQPLKELEKRLDIELPKEPLEPSMVVHMDGETITRYRDRKRWISEAADRFGNFSGQKSFWELAYRVSDIVWKVSGQNPSFPPNSISDVAELLKNDPRDLWILPYALKSVKEVVAEHHLDTPSFLRFLDEQLMISAQATASETPFIFGAPAITYTSCTNYYVPGGLISMIKKLEEFITEQGGELHTKEKVLKLHKNEGDFLVYTDKNETEYHAPVIISNIPVWNMESITTGETASYFKKKSKEYSSYWGAITMGVVTNDIYPADMPLHHQIHLQQNDRIPGINSKSLFVSFSKRGDTVRAPKGDRVLNISTHTIPEFWYGLNSTYDVMKSKAESCIIDVLKRRLPEFAGSKIKLVFSGTPVTWEKWVHRYRGRVGGIPQSMDRSLLDWVPNKTPFPGLYLCGDTVFPGQGIPGVTLSGLNVYYEINKNHNKDKFRWAI